MYFPYLYAKQFDLLACRNLISAASNVSHVIPVLEPVSARSRDLKRCAERFGSANKPLIIVMNPSQGGFKSAGAATWRADMAEVLRANPALVAGYLCRQTTAVTDVGAFLSRHPKNAKALLYASPTLSRGDVSALGKDGRVAYHIDVRGVPAAHLAVLPRAKLASIRDYFNKRPRNADYTGQEFFTDAHKTTTTDYAGYGDFTMTGAAFVDNGGPAAAVAIHLTYKDPNSSDIWIEHFISDDVEIEVGDVSSKYLQAARKATRAVRARPAEFGRNEALDAMADDVRRSHYPGLGKSKERQILHHMLLTNAVLDGKL